MIHQLIRKVHTTFRVDGLYQHIWADTAVLIYMDTYTPNTRKTEC